MFRRFFRAGLVVALFVLVAPAMAYAQYTSPSYKVNEVLIGGGSVQDSCSLSYCSNQSAGDTAVGNTSSNSYKGQAGSQTSAEPTLEVQVTNATVDLGVLNTSGTSAASFNFSISTYLSSGYVVKILGQSPTYTSGPATHTLTALNSPTTSSPGVEQFGINLVANGTPGIGANPVQVPNSTFAHGQASSGYDSADHFKFVNGDIIAESTQASGETDYTVSVIANVANSTPGGRYETVLVVQAIATF